MQAPEPQPPIKKIDKKIHVFEEIEAIFIYLFIIYIKNLLKFPFIYNIAIIIPFSYSAYNIITFFLINICLARDLFRKPKADF